MFRSQKAEKNHAIKSCIAVCNPVTTKPQSATAIEKQNIKRGHTLAYYMAKQTARCNLCSEPDKTQEFHENNHTLLMQEFTF